MRVDRKPCSCACLGFAASLCCWWLLAACGSFAQTPPAERTFHVSKAEVQKTLLQIPAYAGGKLPVLEGFAEGDGHVLDNYKRGFYQFDIQLKTVSPSETTVHVTAKITAWYAGATTANSGYRLLKSSGRLESDLLDALDDKLNPNAAARSSAPSPKAATAAPLPDSPSASASFFNTQRLTTAPSSAKPASSKVAASPPSKQAKALTQEAENLQLILHNQTRPADLAVVKRANTPVVAQPLDGAEVLFQADAEDEFQILDVTDTWVHVQISGLSRGWIRREHVDVPGAARISVAAIGDQHEKDAVRQTKEEVAPFPGKWEPLDGRQVKIIWVQPLTSDKFGSEPRWNLVKSVFRKADAGAPNSTVEIAGVVVIFDAEDGGMAATTLASLQQWRAGHLSDDVFWRRCWRDPADAFKGQN
ncbi:MAG: hypothetical protein WCC87_22345 [Candidatus Korobacteraceae bacterium]